MEKSVFSLFMEKLLGNFTSVKVWFFILPFLASTGIFVYICYSQFGLMVTALEMMKTNPALIAAMLGQIKIITDTFIAWCTFNITLTGSILAVREVYKIRRLREINEADSKEKVEKIENVNV